MADTGLNFNVIKEKISGNTATYETNLKANIDGIGANPTTADMLKLQFDIQQWSVMTNLQSTITKELGDTLKSVIQKAA